MRPVVVPEDTAPLWTLPLAARMAVFGVRTSTRRVPRREVWAEILTVARHWFRQVTALPGDEFDEFVRDVQLRVTEVKPSSVTCEARSGHMLEAGYGWDALLPANVHRCYEVRPRKPLGWWLR